MQGKWLEEQAKTTRSDAELKHVHAELIKEKLCIMSMRQEREELMTAEAKYTERARVLETSSNENKQMIRDVVSQVDDICEQVDTAHAVEAVKQAVEEVGKSLLSQTDSLLTDKLKTFGAIVEQV